MIKCKDMALLWTTNDAKTTYRKVHSEHCGTSAQRHRLKQTRFYFRHVISFFFWSTTTTTTTMLSSSCTWLALSDDVWKRTILFFAGTVFCLHCRAKCMKGERTDVKRGSRNTDMPLRARDTLAKGTNASCRQDTR